ncbi:MAG: hypothetical protein FWG45_08145, partial [Oscillospiraceae bacterium]|nr:hypothetical protein [Oscillospiraceae bacterium]
FTAQRPKNKHYKQNAKEAETWLNEMNQVKGFEYPKLDELEDKGKYIGVTEDGVGIFQYGMSAFTDKTASH